MWKQSWCTLVFAVLLSVVFAAPNESLVIKHINADQAATFSLHGPWQFMPLEDSQGYHVGDIRKLDEKARELKDGKGIWYPLSVPQFLNEYKWWCEISAEHARRDQARLAALPFDAEETQMGFYKKTFVLPERDGPGPEVRVDFEGVAMISRVYINGHHVGGHFGMFAGFDCRLTPHLNWGGENELLVFVQRGVKTESTAAVVDVAVTVPLTADMLVSLNAGMFGGFGVQKRAMLLGIWQPVELRIIPARARLADVFFKPGMDGHEIDVDVHNPTDTAVAGHLSYRLTDKKTGETLTDGMSDGFEVAPDATVKVTLRKEGLDPKLWEPDLPNLYELEMLWEEDGAGTDRYACNVGYRVIEVREHLIYLNGRPYYIRGANQPPYGYDPNNETLARGFFQNMHDGNTVVTRAAKSTLNHTWYDAADEIGVGISVGGIRPWALIGKDTPLPPEPILNHWFDEQLEVVKQYRNHPSILFYCTSNEGLAGKSNTVPERHKIMGDLTQKTKELDPTRLTFLVSGGRDVFNYADVEDPHSYFGWYHPSAYTFNMWEDIHPDLNEGARLRPLVSQEMAIGYTETDEGRVMMPYYNRYNAQAWVGDLYRKPHPVDYFLEHVRATGKRFAELQRYQREKGHNNGYMLFANNCWTQHVLTHKPEDWKPFPVWYGVRDGLEPVLAALETPQYVFTPDTPAESMLYLVNDDARGRDLKDVLVTLDVMSGEKSIASTEWKVGDVDYYAVESKSVSFSIPVAALESKQRNMAALRLTTRDASGVVLAVNTYPIQIVAEAWTREGSEVLKGKSVLVEGCSQGVIDHIESLGAEVMRSNMLRPGRKADIAVSGPRSTVIMNDTFARQFVKTGGRLVLLEPGAKIAQWMPGTGLRVDEAPMEAIVRDAGGEFVEMRGYGEQPIFEGLDPMDWKWWFRGSKKPAILLTRTYQFDGEDAPEGVALLGHYLRPHSYWHPISRIHQSYRENRSFPVVAKKFGWGEILATELMINDCIVTDPRAAKTLTNFLTGPVNY